MYLQYQSELTGTSYGECDLVFDSGTDLETAVLISLLSWRRVTSEELPQGETDQLGWWGDNLNIDKLGSKLWLLKRKKMLPQLKKEAHQYITESLQWLIDDGAALKIDIQVDIIEPSTLTADITIYQNDGKVVKFNFDNIWNQIK
jgi:phage gp46-like protein